MITDSGEKANPSFMDAGDITDGPSSELGPPIIDGLLRAREVANFIASPKVGKTFLAISLAVAVARGGLWLGHQCTAGRVLYLDNELHLYTLQNRIKMICTAQGIPPQSLQGKLSFETFRGRMVRYDGMAGYMAAIAREKFSLIIVDAHYKFAIDEENSNDAAAATYSLIDSFAAVTGAAFVLVHHASKGSQSEKSVTDVGSGAGAQSRAADTHIILRPHDEEGLVVMEGRCRTWPTPKPLTIKYAYPVWSAEPDIPPKLASGRHKKAKEPTTQPKAKPKEPPYRKVVGVATDEPKPLIWFTAQAHMSPTRARQLLSEAVEMGELFLWMPVDSLYPYRWSTVKENS